MIKITLPDQSVREYAEGITGEEIARDISPRLAKEVLAITVNDQLYDLHRPIQEDANIKLHKWEDAEGKHAFWHSSATCWPKLWKRSIPESNLELVPPSRTVFITMWIRATA